MEHKFNNFIHTLQKGKMSVSEKTAMKNTLMNFVAHTPVRIHTKSIIVKSPYTSFFSFGHISKLVGVAMLIVVLGIGGVSGASADALPGDLLYPIKVNLKEKIEEKIAFTTVAKLAFKQKKLETRLAEVEALANKQALTPILNAEIDSSINAAAADLTDDLNQVQKTDPVLAAQTRETIETKIDVRKARVQALIREVKQDKPVPVRALPLTVPPAEILDTKTDHSSKTSKSEPVPALSLKEAIERLRKNQAEKDATPTRPTKIETQKINP